MRTEYLSEFTVLADTKSYSAAAHILGIGVSALSRHIAALEEETGCILFTRTSRSVSLTADGQRLLVCACRVSAAMEEFSGRSSVLQNQLTVGYIAAAAGYGILGQILSFRKNHPEYSIILNEGRTEQVYHQLLRAECDMAVCYEYPFPDYRNVRRIPMMHDIIVCALPESHPLAKVREISLSQLSEEVFLMHHEGSWMTRMLMALFEDAGFVPRVRYFQKLSHKYQMELVARGEGIALCEKNRSILSSPRVSLISLVPEVRKNVCLMMRKEPLTCAAAAFLDYMTGTFTSKEAF